MSSCTCAGDSVYGHEKHCGQPEPVWDIPPYMALGLRINAVGDATSLEWSVTDEDRSLGTFATFAEAEQVAADIALDIINSGLVGPPAP